MLSCAVGIFLLLEVAHADHQPRDAVGLVHRQDAVGELDGLVDVAIGQRGDEGAVEQFVVLRIGAQRRAIERRGGSGVALDAGMARGQIAAGRRQRFQIGLARELRGVVARYVRASAPKPQPGAASAARVTAAIVQRLKRVESITVRLAPGCMAGSLRSVSNANPSGGIKVSDNAAFGAQPQGYGVGESIGRLGP